MPAISSLGLLPALRHYLKFLVPCVGPGLKVSGSVGLLMLLLLPSTVKADEEWIFLPPSPLFQPLIDDPREPSTSLIVHTNENRYEGAAGATAEFFRYLPPDQTKWAIGLFGSSDILFTQMGDNFPIKASDWYIGLFFSESYGAFASRIEYEHQSAHLGDSLQGIQVPIIYNGENVNLTESFQPWEDIRFAVQIEKWTSGLPEGKKFSTSIEGELYSPGIDIDGTFMRGYAAANLRWKDEAGGALDQNFEVGVQWKFKKEETRDLRVAFVYYNGNSQFGQLYLNHDEHMGIGIYFDP